MDITRGVDWLHARMQERIFSKLVNLAKVPFTNKGIGIVEAEIRGQLEEGVEETFLAEDPVPTVTVPLAAGVSSANKALRLLPDMEFDAVPGYTIHSAQNCWVRKYPSSVWGREAGPREWPIDLDKLKSFEGGN